MKYLNMAAFLVLVAIVFTIIRTRNEAIEAVAQTDVANQAASIEVTSTGTSAPRATASATDNPALTAREFYISKNGNNADGLSWETAWDELDQIQWEFIRPGVVIYIDGGESEMRYETEMVIGSDGTESEPIRIEVSTESGHDGQVIFFGGRDIDLPYCGQKDYENLPDDAMREHGIKTNGHDYIIIDGQRWSGIQIHGFRDSGIRFDADSRNITVRYVEVYNNGSAEEDSDGWNSGSAGVRLAGENITLQRVIIHDNGQDAIQSLDGENHIHNFLLEQSWLYNGRKHPEVNESANYCTHTDGIQLYDGGEISDITITESFFGPGFTQNILFGQDRTDSGSWAAVSNVTIRDVVFSKSADNGVIGYRDTDANNWLLDHVTIDCLETKSHCIRIENSNHEIRDSIIINGKITFPDGLDSYSGNCLWNTEGNEIGDIVDPQFANVTDDMFSLDDYTPADDSPCQGSRIGSVEQLMSLD